MSQFEKLLNVGTNRMLSGLSAYHIWRWLNLAINTNHPNGKEFVDKNLEIMNRHNIFFSQLIRSTYKSFVVDLSVFFDKDGYDESFSINKLLKATRDKLNDKEIKTLEQQIGKIKKVHGVSIGFIRELRDADAAHQEIDSKARHLLYENIEKLFAAVQEILNLISQKYDQSVHWWNHVPTEVERQMEWIMGNLERGEQARVKEIEGKWKIEPLG